MYNLVRVNKRIQNLAVYCIQIFFQTLLMRYTNVLQNNRNNNASIYSQLSARLLMQVMHAKHFMRSCYALLGTACSIQADKQRSGRNIRSPRQIDSEPRSKYVRYSGYTSYCCQMGFRTKTWQCNKPVSALRYALHGTYSHL